MDNLILELAKQIPSAMAVIGTVYLFLKAAEKERVERVSDAVERTKTQQAHDLAMESSRRGRELEINNLWASTVKNMMTAMEASDRSIIEAIKEMRGDMLAQYEKMGITKSLIDMANKTQ